MPDTDVAVPSSSYSPSAVEASATNRLASLPAQPGGRRRAISRRVWLAFAAAWAVFTGLLPHVLHHAGPLAGAALFAGVGGSLLFFALGLVAAIPFLRRLHRRFGDWWAPGVALALFVVVFGFSTFVIGPRISGGDEGASSSAPQSQAAPAAESTSEEGHAGHH